jgi:hypothetical protein
MPEDELIDAYLAKADEADDHAYRCRDRAQRENWIGKARGHREMAQRLLHRVSGAVRFPGAGA